MESKPRYTVASDGLGSWNAGQPNPSLKTKPIKVRQSEDFGSLLDLIGDLKDRIVDQDDTIAAMRDHLASLTELVHGKTESPLTHNVEQLTMRDAA